MGKSCSSTLRGAVMKPLLLTYALQSSVTLFSVTNFVGKVFVSPDFMSCSNWCFAPSKSPLMMAKQPGRSSWYSEGIGRGLIISAEFFKFKSQMSTQIMINRTVIHPVYSLLIGAMVCGSNVGKQVVLKTKRSGFNKYEHVLGQQ